MQSELYQYVIFAEAAECGSISKAAQKLWVTQPAVSRAVKQLEDRLGVRLLARGARGVTLTEPGAALYQYVRQAMACIEGAENYISELKDLCAGSLHIGANDTVCRHYLIPYLRGFGEKYPAVGIHVTNRVSSETAELLRAGAIDIGFVNGPAEAGGGFASRPLTELNDCFVCGQKYFEKYSGTVNLESLDGETLLMLEETSSTRRQFDAFCKCKGITLTPQIELGSHDLLLEFAAAGLGVALVVREFSQEYIADGRLHEVKLADPPPPRNLYLIYRERLPLSPAARRFVEMLAPPADGECKMLNAE